MFTSLKLSDPLVKIRYFCPIKYFQVINDVKHVLTVLRVDPLYSMVADHTRVDCAAVVHGDCVFLETRVEHK